MTSPVAIEVLSMSHFKMNLTLVLFSLFRTSKALGVFFFSNFLDLLKVLKSELPCEPSESACTLFNQTLSSNALSQILETSFLKASKLEKTTF